MDFQAEFDYFFAEARKEFHLSDYPVHLVSIRASSYVYRISESFCLKILPRGNQPRLDPDSFRLDDKLCLPILTLSSPSSSLIGQVFPFLNGNTLQYYIKNDIRFDYASITRIIYDILYGMHVLHCSGYVHTDMHPANIMLDIHDSNISAYLIDFEETCRMTPDAHACFRYSGYNAPEVVLYNESYGEVTESFTAGVMLWELLFGECPFGGYNYFGKYIDESWEGYQQNKDEIEKNVKSAICRVGEYLGELNDLPSSCSKLLRSLINPDAILRASATEAIRLFRPIQ